MLTPQRPNNIPNSCVLPLTGHDAERDGVDERERAAAAADRDPAGARPHLAAAAGEEGGRRRGGERHAPPLPRLRGPRQRHRPQHRLPRHLHGRARHPRLLSRGQLLPRLRAQAPARPPRHTQVLQLAITNQKTAATCFYIHIR